MFDINGSCPVTFVSLNLIGMRKSVEMNDKKIKEVLVFLCVGLLTLNNHQVNGAVWCNRGERYGGGAFGGCHDCSCGQYQSKSVHRDTTCSTCGVGHYSGSGASSCSTCGPGMFSGSGSCGCTKCPPGTYNPSSGRSECIHCPQGHYQPDEGQTTCDSFCFAGTYADGAMRCQRCDQPWLTTSLENSTECTISVPVLNFEAGSQLLLDRSISSCHAVITGNAVTFTMDTSSTEFSGLRPVHIAAHLQQDGSCNGLTMIFTKSLNPGCRRYKNCRLLNSSSVNTQCIFECHCDEDTCFYGLISFLDTAAGTNVCELYVVW